MSISKLQELFGGEEVMLELLESESGELVLRNGGETGKQLVKIEFDEALKEALGEKVHLVAQHMVQAVLFNLLEQQLGEWHAEIVDEPPKHYS